MKYTKLLLMLLVYTQLLQAQPRINRNTNVSISKVSPIATNFIGWKYNDFVGKWVAYYNQIEDGYFDHNDIRPSRIKAEVQAAGENLQSIRLRKVIYNSKPYYILSIGRYAGVYMYPSICKDWRYWKEAELYLLFPDQYKKLLNLGKDNDIILYYTINVSSIADIKSIQQAFPYIFKGKDMDEETAKKSILGVIYTLELKMTSILGFNLPFVMIAPIHLLTTHPACHTTKLIKMSFSM